MSTNETKTTLSNTTYKTYEKELPVLPFIFDIIKPIINRSKQ
jgi:hypothetical protein